MEGRWTKKRGKPFLGFEIQILRYYRTHEFLVRQQFSECLLGRNKINFRAGVRKTYPKKVKPPTFVDGINNSSRASSLFRDK